MTGEGLSVAQAASFYGVRVFVCTADQSPVNILAVADAGREFNLYTIDGWGTPAVHKLDGTILDFILEGASTLRLDMDCPIQMEAANFYEAWVEECRRKDEELLASLPKRELDIYTVTVADKARLPARRVSPS
jgi:hypothetical protein